MSDEKQLLVRADAWEKLRRPFDDDEIELLPKYTGKKGPDGRPPREAYRECDECGRYHPFPCVHLRYVGHAGVTERLNEVDPTWNWEPAALDDKGIPVFADGGMWIKLTVLGVTRWGFGDAQGKRGPNAVKETIGDAIRNAAMRFGVATYLWSKSEKAERMIEAGDEECAQPEDARTPPPARQRAVGWGEFNELRAAAVGQGHPDTQIMGFLKTFGKDPSDFSQEEIDRCTAYVRSMMGEER